MSIKDEFDRQFQPVIEDMVLPERLAGRYRPESCLLSREGREVWLLRDEGDGQYVLKIDRTGQRDLAGEYALMERLPRDLAGRVPLPVDCFEEAGVQYLLRTYLPGRPLSETWTSGDVPRCVEIGKKLCALLERLHSLEEPVIHRDIKPENIILSPEGEPGLIDFGIARVYKEGRDSDTVMMGTRSTAPPEQYGYAQTDRRADIYSLGVTLRWMLTGSYRPEALDGANCPEGLKKCLNRAASFDPEDRYPSAGAFGRALDASLKKPRRRGILVAAACLVVVLVLVLCWPRSRPVEFDNALLEQAVRYELDKPEGDVTSEDLERVERLAVVGVNLLGEEQDYSYTLFGYVDDVPQRDTPHGDISDLSLLARMPNLKTLYLCQQQIEDVTPLSGLPLEELYLADNNITDFSPLETLPQLRTLFLGNNPARDLSPLASLSRLRELNLDSLDGYVDSFAPLSGLRLRTLHLGNQHPDDGDWFPLGTLDQVEELYLWSPPDAALPALSGMDSLRHLSLGDFQGSNLTGLDLPRLTYLGLWFHVNSLEGIQQLENLEHLDLEGMEGLPVEPLAALERLSFLSVNNCKNMDYSPLLRIPSLEYVEVWDEQCLQELERDCPEDMRIFKVIAS